MMDYPLWLIPALPLLGFLLNGTASLIYGSLQAARRSEAYRKEHPESEHGNGHGNGHGNHAPESHGHGSHGDDHGHGHAGFLLPYGLRLFHGIVGVGTVGLSCVLAFGVLIPYAKAALSAPEAAAPVVETLYRWISIGSFAIDIAFRLDTLSAVMLSFVTFVGTLIHLYSVGYMQSEEGYGRFFAYLNLFMFSMLILITANNLPMLFIGWEGVGLCSYLLIGYYYDKDFAAAAGKKAFVVNRIGDLAMILGIFGVFALFGTADFSFVEMARNQALNGQANISVYLVCLLLFGGACGKSAQVPLYVWLPDAMAGPTPVSALIHAATMVTAGVYLVARCSALYLLAPDAMTLVAWVGAGTAIFAATIGLAQNDIKKVLAYSTVSQLGYMFLACGVGAFAMGIFHVYTHAFFKACLFLGSGSVIHALHHEQDIRRMGGLKGKIPATHMTMLVSALAIAGIFPLAGFFSKDQILGAAFANGNYVLFAVGLVTAGMTAFYMFRLYRMTFSGDYRGSKESETHIHESPLTMTLPLWILATLSAVAGFLGLPEALHGTNVFIRFLEPSVGKPAVHHVSHATEYGLMLGSLVVAIGGILLAWRWYTGKNAEFTPGAAAEEIIPSPAAHAFFTKTGKLGPIVANKWNVDEGIDALILNPFRKIGNFLWRGFDALFIDGLVNASAFMVELTGDLTRFFTTGNVRNYALTFTLGVLGLAVYIWLR